MGIGTWIGRGITTLATTFVGLYIGDHVAATQHLAGAGQIFAYSAPTLTGLGLGYYASTKLFKGAPAVEHAKAPERREK